MVEIIVRGLEPEDLPAVNEIHNQRVNAAMTLQVPHTPLSERESRFTTTDAHRALVAEIDGRLVGMLGLTLWSRRRAHVGSLGMSVQEEFHGHGVGTALMEAAVDLADNWYNLRRLELEVYVDNQPAIRLYEKFGFEIEGTHRAYAYRLGSYVDAHSMARLRDDPGVLGR